MVCRRCKKPLEIGVNWSVSKQKNSDKICKTCISQYDKLRNKNKKIKELKKESSRRFRENNKGYYKEYNKEYRIKNRDKLNEYERKYYKDNPEKRNAKRAKRRFHKRKASVDWANDKKIEQFYKLAKNMTKLTKKKYEVDHIIPLINDKVCGLHVENNLRVISKISNAKKGNKHE